MSAKQTFCEFEGSIFEKLKDEDRIILGCYTPSRKCGTTTTSRHMSSPSRTHRPRPKITADRDRPFGKRNSYMSINDWMRDISFVSGESRCYALKRYTFGTNLAQLNQLCRPEASLLPHTNLHNRRSTTGPWL